jgi:hypothetical protein
MLSLKQPQLESYVFTLHSNVIETVNMKSIDPIYSSLYTRQLRTCLESPHLERYLFTINSAKYVTADTLNMLRNF